MATFGFDRKDPLSVSRLITTKPKLTQRKTEELKGSEDNGISTPFNFRKEGSINEPEAQDDNFLSPEERINYQERGIYNPKTGGYTYPVQSMNYGDEEFYNRSTTYGDRRPSSGVFDPLLSPRPPMAAATGPRMTGVTVQDLWPPPMPAILYMTTRTQKTVSSRYSRPIDGNVPVRDSFMGFGNR